MKPMSKKACQSRYGTISTLPFMHSLPPLQLTSLSHHSTPHLDHLPLRSGDLSFEAEVTGTLAASPGE